jgi:hypothetical protein
MGSPVQWPGANRILAPPKGMDETQCSNLAVFSNGVTCVSCWELSEEELDEIIRSRCVFLSVFSGGTQPPVFVGSEDEVRRMIADYGAWKK